MRCCASRPDTEPCSLEAAGQAVVGLVEKLVLEGCVLVGYSLGARLALLMSLRYGDKFGSSVIISGSPGIPGKELYVCC